MTSSPTHSSLSRKPFNCESVDLVHTIMVNASAVAAYLYLKLRSKPSLLTLQEGDSEEYIRGYLGPFLVLGWGVRNDRIAVVHNSLPDVQIVITREAARQALSFGPSSRDTVIVSAGRLVPWKRFDLLIRLMPGIRSAVSSARLLIIGTGPCEKELRELVAGLKLDKAVTLVGRLDADRMRLHLMASDILVLASSYEGFSHLLLESMRAGLPVVATDAGGNHELIQNGSSGILVPIDKPDRLAAALVELCKNPTSRARLARAGRERSTYFTWEKMVDATVAALRRAPAADHDHSAAAT